MQGRIILISLLTNLIFIAQKTKKCVAMNWNKKKVKCYLLSSYKNLQNKKGWTAGYVGDSGTCKPKITKNKAYKYDKSALISKPTKTKNVQDCLKACTGVIIRKWNWN